MCGIAGYARAWSSPSRLEDMDVLRSMTEALRHRGPDADGYAMTDRVALGHRRLSVIDIVGGPQPMCDEQRGLSLVYNGEIYNYLELNGELRSLGFEARTRSDTETVLLAYAAWGEKCVERFNGMFSFVIHDASRRRLFGARDRMGQKPLYYVHDGSFFAFASEPKSLLRHPQVKREMDLETAARFLLFEHVPAPHAIYRGMNKLPAGHRFVVDLNEGGLSIDAYWELPNRPDETISPRDRHSEQYWVERIRTALTAAIKRRLIADVPLGVFLSGGIDSSAVAATIVKKLGIGDVKTFTIASTDRDFALTDSATDLAGALGTDHHQQVLDPDATMDVLPTVSAMLDEPLADSSILPTYLLSKFTREHVTVALTGDGGDEMYAGYVTFKALPFARFYNAVMPGLLHRRAVVPLAARLPVRRGYLSLDFKVNQFLRGLKAPEPQRLWRWLGAFVVEDLETLLSDDALSSLNAGSLYDELHEIHAEVADRDAVARDCYVYGKTYLAEEVLCKVDRATMACSLEARSPLLDVDLVQMAASIPSTLKLRRGGLKHIFRRALDGLVPSTILDGPKTGFGAPVGAWFAGPLKSLLCDTLSESNVRDGGFLRPQAVQALIDDHLSGRRNCQKQLFALFMLERWRQTWLSSQPS